ncbi:hypothetical protein BXZ70DRAFT_1059549 [Cristinia sonorae]|uniref:DUF6533 domain-containing protein n=1 Tax=Cristinia sonorae TaxID=1940300 RepID=A0A8K0UT36_9AGAR|nr:hypothetical protein BXZ70DRAFT_1059549 [Cristinia sonorae]
MSTTSAQFNSDFNTICVMVAAVLLAFDYLITFSREVHTVWGRKFSAVTLIFALERYAMLFLGLLRLWDPPTLCKIYSIITYTVAISVLFGVALFSTLRVYAISGRITLPVIAVFLCSMFAPSANIYNYSRHQIFEMDPISGCTPRATPESIRRDPRICSHLSYTSRMPIVTRSIAILTDLLVLAITWRKSMYIFKASLRMKQFKPRISVLLMRDGTIYFVALSILNLVTLILNIKGYLGFGGTSFTFIADAIAPILISRFILDLRGVTYLHEQTITDDQNGSMHFAATSFVGQLAAPLDTAFGPSDDRHHQRDDLLRAREPFMVGLEPDHRDTGEHGPERRSEIPLHNLSRPPGVHDP